MSNVPRAPFRYIPYFSRDVLRFPLSLFAMVAVLMGVLFWRLGARFGRPRVARGDAPGIADVAASIPHQVQVGTWNVCLTVAVLMAISTVIGNDISRGYYRTWFAKPMPAWWYYLQRFFVGAAAVMLAPVLLGLALAATLGAGMGLDGPLMTTIALGTLLIGSATLLLSVFSSRAWLLVFLMGTAQGILGGLIVQFGRGGQELPTFFVWLHKLLPPLDLIDPMKPALSGGPLLHVVLYGGAMLVLALVLLRWRPLGTGGRS